MATLSIQEYDEAGNDLTMAAASSGGDQVANVDGEVELIIVNNDTASKTVTVASQINSFDDDNYGNSVKQDQSVTVSSGGGVGKMGPFKRKAFNDSNNNIQISYDAVTSLEIAAVKRK